MLTFECCTDYVDVIYDTGAIMDAGYRTPLFPFFCIEYSAAGILPPPPPKHTGHELGMVGGGGNKGIHGIHFPHLLDSP